MLAASGSSPPTSTAAELSTRGQEEPAYPRTYHLFGGARDFRSLARYDLIVGYAYWDVRALRKRNPSGVFLLSPGLRPHNSRDYRGLSVTYGAIHRWTGGVDRLRGGPKLRYIRPFDPYWDALYKADGTPAKVNETWQHGGWNLADPKGKGTPQLVAKVIAHASKRGGIYARGWDGVHSDNWIYRIGVSWFYGEGLDTDRDGHVDDYDVLRRKWAQGLTRVGLLLRDYLPGKVVGGNGNWNVRPGVGVDFTRYLARRDDHLRSANYTLLEELQNYAGMADEVVAVIREWLEYADPRGQKRYFAVLHRLEGPDEFRSMRWGLSLATIAGAHYEAYSRSHEDMFWYDEYDGGRDIRRRNWLGKPVSAPRRLSGGVWVRDFQHGLVLNNSTTSAQNVRLQGAFRRLDGSQDGTVNDGTAVSEVTLPARDGLFLLRMSPSRR